jgi:hypothetical protein
MVDSIESKVDLSKPDAFVSEESAAEAVNGEAGSVYTADSVVNSETSSDESAAEAVNGEAGSVYTADSVVNSEKSSDESAAEAVNSEAGSDGITAPETFPIDTFPLPNPINPLSKCDPQTHEFPIAYIGGEVTKLESADVIEISFQKWCVEWCDFLKIFYNCSNDFKVGQHLKCDFQKIIAFNQQREYCFKDSIDGSASFLPYCLPFNLKDKVIDTWTQELKEKDNCKSIDRCSLMKLTKELNQLRTIADMYKLCKLKVESISRVDLVEEIIKCYANPRDKFCFNISVQINPESGGLTPILLNFKYEVSFANERQYFELDPTGQQLILNYNMVLCPPKCECCKPKFLCKDACRCLPGIDNYTNPPEGK